MLLASAHARFAAVSGSLFGPRNSTASSSDSRWSSPSELLRNSPRDAAAIPVKIWLAVLSQGVTGIDLQSTLPRLKAPALLIWGAKDQIFGPQDRRALQQGLPGARVVLYPEFGHNPFWEDPQRVAREIDAFLAE